MKNNSGGILIMVMGMISIMLIMGITFLTVKGFEQKVGLNHKDSIQAQYVAEAGVARVIELLNTNPGWRGTLGPMTYFDGSVTAQAYLGYDGEAIIVSTGAYGNAKKKIILSVETP